MGHPRRQRGFTLIELAVAIAIVATAAGLVLPALQGVRVSRNAAAATATLSEVRAAQEVFRSVDRDGDGVLEYAGSLDELVAAGLLDEDLGDGRRQGYVFQTASRNASSGYVYVATPMNQGQTGVRGFGGDASGILATDCPPGEHPAVVDGGLVCAESDPPEVALPLGETSAVAAVDSAALLGGAVAIDRARSLLAAGLASRVTTEFDADRDAAVSFTELLQADLLAMARRLAAEEPALPGGTIPIGDDRELDAVLRRLQTRIRQDLALGAGDEAAPPAAPTCAAVGFPELVLDRAAVARVRASLDVLLDLANGLEPTPDSGDMTSSDEDANRTRKRRLVRSVSGMAALWNDGDLAGLRGELGAVRERADGRPNPGDWVQGTAADRMAAGVDATLALIAPGR